KTLTPSILSASSNPVIFLPTSNVPGYPPDDITTHTAASGDQRKSPSLTLPSIEASSASHKSLSSRMRIGCVSGSPKRQLNSNTRNESSSPCRHSSSTTRDPASPSIFPLSISDETVIASSLLLAITTPLPAASPSAFTTTGGWKRGNVSLTSFKELQIA